MLVGHRFYRSCQYRETEHSSTISEWNSNNYAPCQGYPRVCTFLHQYVFASFVGRDGTYDLLTSIWRLSHPDSRSPDDPYGDDSESVSPSSGSFSDDEESVSEEERSVGGDSNGSEDGTEEESSAPNASAGSPASEKKGDEAVPTSSLGETGPESHEKTECDCGKDGHYEKVVCDEVVKASLGKVWNCVYGENKDFMMSFLRDNQKVTGMFHIG